jgi:hypothetical protein
MSQLQQESDLEALLQTDTEGSNMLYGPDVHALSLGDDPRDWDQSARMVESPGTSDWHEHQANERSL